jgi:hypothetical protein
MLKQPIDQFSKNLSFNGFSAVEKLIKTCIERESYDFAGDSVIMGDSDFTERHGFEGIVSDSSGYLPINASDMVAI